jgi:hypothetical protein
LHMAPSAWQGVREQQPSKIPSLIDGKHDYDHTCDGN